MIKMTRAKAKRTERNRNSGFTMVEMLAVASIIITLLAVGMAGILRYRAYLRITELDNLARSIYVAAQNRAVLLDNDGRFRTLVTKGTQQPDGSFDGGGTPITVTVSGEAKDRWYIDSKTTTLAATDTLNDLLPMGTIDPALRNGRFYVLYEPDSASVTDVFFMEEDFALDISYAVNDLGADDKRDNRMKYKPMVGWFGSNGAAGRDGKLSRPSVKVLIENSDELTLTVTYKYTLPADLPAGVDVTRKPSVKLEYNGNTATLMDEPSQDPLPAFSARATSVKDTSTPNSVTYTCTWVLDSLAKDSSGGSQQFKDLGSGSVWTDLGKNFTVTASLWLTADGYQASDKVEDSGTGNSLFAEGSATTPSDASLPDYTNTAFIAKLRHLQNLDVDYSNVSSEITKAEQTANIDASTLKDNKGDTKDTDWKFKPIRNSSLTCYQDSRTTEAPDKKVDNPYFIENLKVTDTDDSANWHAVSSSKKKVGAGVFGELDGVCTLQNVYLKESIIEGHKKVGALVGHAGHITLKNCRIEKVKVTGLDTVENVWWNNSVGGLVGFWWGSAEFTDCEAKNIEVKSTVGWVSSNYVGGLAGMGYAKGTFTRCTVKGDTNLDSGATTYSSISGSSHVGGLIGYLWDGEFSFENCRIEKTKVKSTGNVAGGMAGQIGREKIDSKVIFKDCEAAEYLTVKGSKDAGGLVGGQSAGNIEFTRCMIGMPKEEDATITDATVTIEGDLSVGGVGGLAGNTEGCTATFTDCTVGNPNGKETVTISGNNAGGLAGNTKSATFLGSSANQIIVKGLDYAGGLAGRTENASFEAYGSGDTAKGCIAENITVYATTSAGGLTGYSTDGSFTNCKAIDVAITGYNDTKPKNGGGLAGSTKDVIFSRCTAGKVDDTVITITAEDYAGGLTGFTEGGSFTECKTINASVTGTSDGSAAGGLTGSAENANFNQCATNKITVKGGTNAGGLAGRTTGTTTFEQCTAGKDEDVNTSIHVTAGYYAGGLTGNTVYDSSTVPSTFTFANCEVVNAKITGENEKSAAGGLTGSTKNAKFQNCTAGNSEPAKKMTVTAESYAGGLTGITVGGSFDKCNAANAEVTGKSKVFKIDGKETGSEVGGLTGRTAGSTGFTSCKVSDVTVAGSMSAGGLAGSTEDASFRTCTSEKVIVIADYYAGGLTGSTTRGSFNECSMASGGSVSGSTGDIDIYGSDNTKLESISSKSEAGGLTGRAQGAKFDNCTAESIPVIGKVNAGGLAGGTENAIFSTCTSTGVTVTADYWAGGLTGNATKGSFTNCEAINARVTGNEAKSEAGGLVGRTQNASITGCKVYLKPDPTNLDAAKEWLVDAETAGGLVGAVINDETLEDSKLYAIENSFAATNVQGKIYAGGLVGNLPDPEDTTKTSKMKVMTSYADCYLQAGQDTGSQQTKNFPYAGGLIGIKGNKVQLELEKVYAAGFIRMIGIYNNPKTAAGLCGGYATVETTKITAQYAYAAMHYTNADVVKPLADQLLPDSTKPCYFLKDSETSGGMTYNQMQNIYLSDSLSGFVEPTKVTTHRYNLWENENASQAECYPFPRLADLDHYGDWVKENNESMKTYVISDAIDSQSSQDETASVSGDNPSDGKDSTP